MTRIALALTIAAIATQATAAPRWGDFKDNGCVEKDLRSYSAVLWDIPWGQSWEVACANQPATVAGQYFPHPTVCVKSSVVDVVGITAAVISFPGIVYPPAGVAGAVLGASAIAMDKGGVGALNMWGVFYVQDPRC